ncbi:helix-turn-helix domain-containing protein [Nevskia ramosa]|uniref:helix-turn-helix domain-containing protein n=1 Tax=Nevskia ramosa TaxID=64002 RepID=UPI002353B6C8|nr:AraC family transcriptional regulator [Nevskia ramosa]
MASTLVLAAPVRNPAHSAAEPGLLITHDRLAYYGDFGRPSRRCLGCWAFYLSMDVPFTLHEDGREARSARFALVPPWTPHRVLPGGTDLAVLLVEPESVDGTALQAMLMATPARRQRTAAALAEGFSNTRSAEADIDIQFFGSALPQRRLDPRIRRVVDLIVSPETAQLSAEQCAARVFLSPSRFMHLFTEQTDTTFRRFRAWKRARRFLSLMAGNPRLVDVALDAGYADSTHLSRSVRNCYGYTPSTLCAFTRGLTVFAQS